MNYHDYLEQLYAINPKGVKCGLANMQAMMALLGSPHTRYMTVHIAGTNGKGSTATKMAAALSKEGYKVGLYTSPHISSFCERIQIDGKMIEEECVAHYLRELFELSKSKRQSLTFFEYATTLALLYFAREKVDIAVLETGLGGRLDPTNVCMPKLSVITSISLDHVALLGETLDMIAYEKAGIMKPGVPCLVGPYVPKSVVQEQALKLGSPLYFCQGSFSNYEEENRAISRSALELLAQTIKLEKASIEYGLEALPPCRFQQISEEALQSRFQGLVPRGVILDVAHNPDGIAKLFARLDEPVTVAIGFSKDKDVEGCLREIGQKNALFLVQAQSPRAMRLDELVKRASPFAYEVLCGGLESAFCYAAEKRQILVICGTFYIMSESRRFLGLEG